MRLCKVAVVILWQVLGESTGIAGRHKRDVALLFYVWIVGGMAELQRMDWIWHCILVGRTGYEIPKAAVLAFLEVFSEPVLEYDQRSA